MKKLPIIIDCDPGTDDAAALMLLHKHKNLFDVKLISSCSGNLGIDVTTNNACFFAKNFFNNVPVSKGYGKPLVLTFEAEASDVHGVGGLGNYNITKQDYPILPNASHIEMSKILKESKEQITIISIGPMTNIALLLSEFPEVKSKIKQIYCMIGSIEGKGNIKPYAEFNAFYDPHAFKIVSESGIPLILNTMEVGKNTCLKKTAIEENFGNSACHQMLKDIILGLNEPDDPTIVRLFDANTALALIKPDLFDFIPCDVEVSTKKDSFGQCFCKKNPKAKNYYQVVKDFESTKKYILDELAQIQTNPK